MLYLKTHKQKQKNPLMLETILQFGILVQTKGVGSACESENTNFSYGWEALGSHWSGLSL